MKSPEFMQMSEEDKEEEARLKGKSSSKDFVLVEEIPSSQIDVQD